MLVITTQSKLNLVYILYSDSAKNGPDNRGNLVRFLTGPINSSVLQNIQTGCGSHISSYLIGTGRFVQGSDGSGLKLTTHLYLAPKRRRSGAILPLPQLPLWCVCVCVCVLCNNVIEIIVFLIFCLYVL
jgi:hypothetical protein